MKRIITRFIIILLVFLIFLAIFNLDSLAVNLDSVTEAMQNVTQFNQEDVNSNAAKTLNSGIGIIQYAGSGIAIIAVSILGRALAHLRGEGKAHHLRAGGLPPERRGIRGGQARPHVIVISFK